MVLPGMDRPLPFGEMLSFSTSLGLDLLEQKDQNEVTIAVPSEQKDQNEVTIAVPLARLLDWAHRVQKQTHFVIVAPHEVTVDCEYDQRSDVCVPEFLAGESSSAQCDVCVLEFCAGDPSPTTLEVLDSPEHCTGPGCSSIAADSVMDYGNPFAEFGSQSTTDKTSQGREIVAAGTSRRRKPRRRARSCRWHSWLELVLIDFSTNLVSDFLEVPVSHMIGQLVCDVGSSLSSAPFLGGLADGNVAQSNSSTMRGATFLWTSLSCTSRSKACYSVGSPTGDLTAEPSSRSFLHLRPGGDTKESSSDSPPGGKKSVKSCRPHGEKNQ
eukprot:3142266-Amphidinium_carterae.1